MRTSTLAQTMREKRNNLQRQVRFAKADGGLLGASTMVVKLGARWASSMMTLPIARKRQRLLDARLGVGTHGEQLGPGLSPLDPSVRSLATFADSTGYQPVAGHHFRKLLKALPSDISEYTFVDLGCGKGLTLLLAAEHGFGHVVGIELEPRLADIAHDNVKSFIAANPRYSDVIDVRCLDAVDYRLPSTPTVIFMYNPFGADTLRTVIQGMEESVAGDPRHFLVAYFNPVHREVLDDSPILRRYKGTTRWVVYEAGSR